MIKQAEVICKMCSCLFIFHFLIFHNGPAINNECFILFSCQTLMMAKWLVLYSCQNIMMLKWQQQDAAEMDGQADLYSITTISAALL